MSEDFLWTNILPIRAEFSPVDILWKNVRLFNREPVRKN